MRERISPLSVHILNALLPDKISLDAVPAKVLAEAVLAHNGNADAKILGRTKPGVYAAVYVASSAGADLISFWDSEFKEVPFDDMKLARAVGESLWKEYDRGTGQRWQRILAHLAILFPIVCMLTFASSFAHSGWSEVLEANLWVTLGLCALLAIALSPLQERVWSNRHMGQIWAESEDKRQTYLFLKSKNAL